MLGYVDLNCIIQDWNWVNRQTDSSSYETEQANGEQTLQ